MGSLPRGDVSVLSALCSIRCKGKSGESGLGKTPKEWGEKRMQKFEKISCSRALFANNNPNRGITRTCLPVFVAWRLCPVCAASRAPEFILLFIRGIVSSIKVTF